MTFAERLEREEWWDEQESLLNLSDINMPPDYYTGSKWEWITEITAYIFREPETWQDIYRQYLVKAQQQGNTEHTRLNYYRDEEGYIRREREDETYLQISTTTADVAVLKRVGEWMCVNSIKSVSYTHLDVYKRQLAVGMTFVCLTGGIDLSVGAVMGCAGMYSAYFAQVAMNQPAIVAIGVGVGVGLLIGVFNGVCVAYLKVPAFVGTLGSMSIAKSLTFLLTDSKPIPNLSESFKFIGGGMIGNVLPIPVIIFAVILLVCF